ncbi:hypothetical protein [Rhizobium sullae]|nr:hypothetical protein [Rhizobium sullae]
MLRVFNVIMFIACLTMAVASSFYDDAASAAVFMGLAVISRLDFEA